MSRATPDPTRIDPVPGELTRFFALTFLVTWGSLFPVVAGVWATTQAVPLLLLSTLGPTVAALVVTWRTRGRRGVRALLARLGRVRVPLRWYAASLLPILLAVSGYAMLDWTGADVGQLGAFGGALAGVPVLVVVPLVLLSGLGGGAVGEELGWRGYALPRLQARLDATRASLLLGVAWGVWHLPLFVLPGVGSELSFGWYLPRVVAITVLMTWVFNHTRGSVLHTMLFHAATNGSEALVSGTLSTPLVALRFGQVVTVLTVVAATLVVVGWGRSLAGGPRWRRASGDTA